MKRESADALKAEILTTVFNRFGTGTVAAATEGAPSERLLAVGIAASTSSQEPGFRPAVRLHKRFLLKLPELVEKQRKGQIDLRFVGDVWAQSGFRGRKRPLEPGLSVGHYNGPTGTLGCFVSKSDDTTFAGVLSNQHVLSQLLTAVPGPNEHTIQSGRADAGHWLNDRIGSVSDSVPIPNPAALQVGGRNTLDCAVARLPSGVPATANRIPGVGPVTGVAPSPAAYLSRRDMFVLKRGRTTGVTKGVITAIDLDQLTVSYREAQRVRRADFTGIFEVEELNGGTFSDGGDSGSLIVDREGLAVGLLFAGSKYGGTNNRPRTFGIPIGRVLTALGVTIPPAPVA